ncbi:branched-chain amino acid aminotransferase [Leucobacter sp. UCD-THU]|jgi:branched-chain amino acid aminotransferase|uniref:Branched-chain-amino-acid aminotransferase n=1 Tax=Leucobacter muris TaxID=1935379 RepID=A0ABX5QG98_9MICO|nr:MULTISPECIES: branched-chain amino acid aminotransferase [Leucobacter]EYT56306.1 branched-chain amino acid aminotransferase [Leucobacter sp. UCD-THU]QAB18089.1 branched-chain amino acid aminotransferase [Leucobacter muris]
MTELTFTRTPATRLPDAEREAVLADPGFGKRFTDHMISIVWDREQGWHDAEVLPYGPIPMDPASSVLHYGQEIFEGLKAYRHPNGDIVTFRPEANAQRLNESAARLALPELPVELFVQAIRELVTVDADWVPSGHDQSLYLRPFMIADESFLGVRAAERARFMVIASPAGPYFTGGVKPVSIWLSGEHARAGRGGTGAAKCGGNYASSLLPTRIAAQHGCAQVLFTDSATEDTIDELGGMNLFLVHRDGRLVTPELNGNILDGITRKSLIRLAQDRGLTVEERKVTVGEWRAGAADGSITEAFACGTAAVITPIGQLKSEQGVLVDFGDRAPGELTMSLRDELTGIQFGTVADRFGWVERIVTAEG